MTPFAIAVRAQSRRALVALALIIVIVTAAAWLAAEAYAEAQFWKAQQALANLDFAVARGHLQRCLSLRPNRFQFHFAAAQLERRMGSFPQARRHLERCQRLAGDRNDVSALEQTLLEAQQGGVSRWNGPCGTLSSGIIRKGC